MPPFAGGLTGTCCACDLVDGGEDRFQHTLRNNKEVYEPVASPDRGRDGRVGHDAPQGGHKEVGTSAGLSSARMIGSQRCDEQQIPEKARLQELVKEFAKRAVRGVPCTLVEADNGRMYPASYHVDQWLKKLTFKPDNLGDRRRVVDMTQIQEIFDYEGATSMFLLSGAIALGVEDRDRLLVIKFSDNTPSVFLLEASSAERDRFIMCMKILRIFAQTDGPDDGA
uniref:Uncharacterized protein n=1 Tax=Noctiluca scintillans TaxID=2966 RepID=A0A7S1FFU4_NOCSC|mmetsp:Transcript_57665/g.153645  ORF Transcript_57665/g.153645 Transcript_57665/m.153645 type:complete len:225 (+) Transcript_57665:127-801(+)|eukprot:CAMPEP_0194482596 /NCGR_PEP_ID=MMETSP0253-20130528/4473_1 /TAXON_ID=2966 /ORGANISM="Noctiluca scintillans" /LENGTH=224 /DNA_ID=CAMNT_0039322141 /DNA_START=115 /DNA_END=789 /DNA_ORIENTATION=+